MIPLAPTVKICGIRAADTLLSMKGLPVDYIGFIFAKSRRHVKPEEAGELIRVLREGGFRDPGYFRTAGVFVNPTLMELEQVLQAAPLDIVQLHGQESPAFCREVKERFGVKIFKAASLPGDGNSESSGDRRQSYEETAARLADSLAPYVPYVDAFLLDTYDPVAGGGSGKTFPWETIPHVRDWARRAGRPLMIAGGLHGNNIGELLERYAPDGVDVSSGVETDGVKDPDKIRIFVERVKQA